MKKCRIIFLTLLLVNPTLILLNNQIEAASQVSVNSNSDLLLDSRGIEIDFNPPDIILDCGSRFILNVTLKNTRNYPRFFSLIVFMDLMKTDKHHNIQRIGNEPFINLAPQEEKHVQIVCFTKNNSFENIKCINSNEKNPIRFIDGRIGVKITKSIRWILDGFYWRYIINNELMFKKFTYNHIYSSFWNFINTKVRAYDKSIQWHNSPVTFVQPFVCTNKIKITDVEFSTEGNDNKVKKKEEITVSFDVINCLKRDITISTLIDIATEKIYNELLPIFPTEIHNLYFKEFQVNASDVTHICFTFKFPNESFRRTTYDLTMECAPYIDIKSTNMFGLYSYDIRYRTLVTPYYLENDTVNEATEHFWYNLPIFNQSDDEFSSIFMNRYFEIEYVGENPMEETVREIINELDNNLLIFVKLFFILFIPAALLWGFIAWIIRKKT